MKKTLVLLLTLAMLATMVVSASAASITINGTYPGETYKAYKILDLESQSGTALSYVVEKDSNDSYPWLAFFEGETGNDWAKAYFTVAGANKYVTSTSGADDQTVAKAIAALAIEYAETKGIAATKEATVDEGANSVVLSDLDEGYYVVTTSLGTLLIVENANADITVNEKNSITQVEKKVSDADETLVTANDAAIGDVVTYTISFVAKVGGLNYVLYDDMSAGLTWSGAIASAKAGEADFTAYTLYSKDNAEAGITLNGNDFAIVIDQAYVDALKADTTITFTYTATINEGAVIRGEGNPNNVTLKYGNNQSSEDDVKTNVYDLGLIKTNTLVESPTYADAKANPLQGAKFSFYVNNKVQELVFVETDANGVDVYRLPVAADTAADKKTVIEAGEIKIIGLDDADTFYFVETEAPAGYNKIDGQIAATIGADEAVFSIAVNKTGSEFPETGGAGTVAFTVVGSLLMLAAVVLFTAKKKMSVQG